MRGVVAVLAATVGCGGGGSTVDGGDPCAAVTCQNGGTCSSHQGNATCACAPAAVWGGPTCTLAIGAEVTEVRVSGSTVAGEPLSMSAALLDPGELATGVVWTLGDGEMLTDSALSRNGATAVSTVEHTYTTAGAYTVTAAASAPVVSVGSKAITVAAPLGSCGKTWSTSMASIPSVSGTATMRAMRPASPTTARPAPPISSGRCPPPCRTARGTAAAFTCSATPS